MGLEFKPYFTWDDEEQDRYTNKCEEKQTPAADSSPSDHSNHSLSGVVGQIGHVSTEPAEGRVGMLVQAEVAVNRDLLAPLAAINGENREYAVLVASEEDNVNEYKSYFSIVLDHPQFLGQGETKESAIRQASRLLHYAFGSLILKNETIPPPSTGAQLEAKKEAMEREWLMVRLENFSMELAPLQFQPGIDYMARPPESDGEYESDHEDEELFELESRMSTP